MVSEGLPFRDSEGGGSHLSGLLMAAHELKGPLSLMRQMANRIERGDASSEEVRELARRIGLIGSRSQHLVNDLTLSRRLDTPEFTELEPIDPVSVCLEIAGEIEPLFRERQRQIEVSHRRKPVLVVANRRLLGSVLYQLADNALNYSDPGRPVSFVTTVARDLSSVDISVRDYGPAVPARIRRGLTASTNHFQPLSRRPESSGLGLYIAREFADSMGAKLGVIRHRDGASFYIRLRGSTQMSLV